MNENKVCKQKGEGHSPFFLNITKQIIIMSWITKSNRLKHFYYAIPIGLTFTELCVLGVASGMEFKDKAHGGKWDWLDWTATMLGGLVGQILQLGIIYLFIL